MKRFLFNAAIPLGVVMMLTSCAQTQKLPKRYKSMAVRNYPAAKDSIKYFVGVSGYATGVPAKAKAPGGEPARNVFSLSGEGQKQLIESIADNEESTDDIYNKLQMDIVPAKKAHAAVRGGRTTRRKVVFAIDDMHATQSDKIQKLTIMLAPPAGGNMKIESCDKLTSNYHKTAGAGVQPVSMSSNVMPDGSLVVTVANMDGNDLTGNIMAEVTLAYTGQMNTDYTMYFSNLWGRDGAAIKPNNIVVGQQMQKQPVADATGKFALSYEATVRHVVAGDNTPDEGDDVVEIVKGKTTGNDIELQRPGQFAFTTYRISYAGKHLELAGSMYNGPLQFSSYEDAQDFIAWLKRSMVDVLANNRIANGDYKIIVSGESNVLTDSFIENCKITTN
jgi:hypothetical protein